MTGSALGVGSRAQFLYSEASKLLGEMAKFLGHLREGSSECISPHSIPARALIPVCDNHLVSMSASSDWKSLLDVKPVLILFVLPLRALCLACRLWINVCGGNG